MNNDKSFKRALRFEWLTSFYDFIIKWTTRENTFKTALIEQALLRPNHEILDIGCGTGTLLLQISKLYPQTTLYGLDADPSIIEIARQKNDSTNNITFIQGFSTALPFDSDTFDRILSTLFFHHLDSTEKEATFHEIFRVLKPGGEVHIADYGPPSNLFMRAAFLPIQLLDGFESTNGNIQGQIERYMKGAGFEKIHKHKSFDTLFGTISLYSATKPINLKL
ncbi:class I SAM-dependent methyltransferase [Parageobacillus galactosidasius]|uniref:Methyltransferase domain-containing protein n=1 Tax=Parageobacillus galactosidasius TaxID=883812 RepID=A0A226QGN7_9BACL|nr:class I SAM-dependent methyltransferase [Parageobacillus galactosidasius]OXB91806.1 hypothetical protein B9L23_10850 [Parageobacillus galactosidasius]